MTDARPDLEWCDCAPGAMHDFLRLVDEQFEMIAGLVRTRAELAALAHAATAQDLDRLQRRLRESLPRAVAGEWAAFEADLRAQGAAQARAGVSLSSTFALVRQIQGALVPLLVQRYGSAPERVTAAFDAMHCLAVRAMAVVADEYLAVRERYHRLIDSVQDYAILMLDSEGLIASWSPGAERLHGYPAEEVIGRHFSCFYAPEDVERDKPAQALAAAASTGRYEDEGWRVRKDGTRFWGNAIITPLRDSAGQLLGFGKVTRDFSQRRKAEQELIEANAFLDSLVEAMPAMVFVKDATNLAFVRFNRAGEELLGWRREDLIGKSDYDFFPKAQADAFIARDREALAKGELVIIPEEPIETRRGSRYLYTKKIPVLNAQGRPVYLLGISLDITEAKKAQEALHSALSELELLNRRLEKQNEELTRASRAKSDFLAMMSHELRTPLNSIIGFSEVLVDQKFGPLNERQARYLRNVNDSGRHLLGLINDLLDLSKIEAGRFEVTPRPCALRPIASDAVATLLPLAASRRVTVEIEPGEQPCVVVADAARLKQVLYNLLSNAIKFVPATGHVTLSFSRVPDSGLVRTSVTDNGPGIAPEDQGRLFTSFTRLGNVGEQEGSGLGLALTKQLVELMGGRVGVQSAPGKGSTFFVELPAYDPADGPGSQRATEARSAPLALVVDDDPAAQELLVLALQEGGFRTLVAATGEDALAKARTYKPDVITLDVFLPTIDGWDVLRLLKTDEKTAEIPVMMVSISSDRGKAFSLGALEHLVKPVARAQLVAALSRHSFTTKVKMAPVHVLAIDDDVKQLEIFRAALEPRGFVIRTATTARAGLEAVQAGPVDLILLDLVMPDLSGVEVVARLRADARTRQTPILLITAHELTAEQRARLNGDVQAIISKGAMRIEDMVDEIARALRPARP